MPQVGSGKNLKLALSYHGPYSVCEECLNCVLVRLVDKPDNELSRDHVVRCSDQLPDTSDLGSQVIVLC